MIPMAFSPGNVGNAVVTILGILIGFGALVFIHELGHFLFAKLVGIRVEAFALGFGPKMLGIKRGETEYKINWIPFGGYVKLAGMEGEDGKDAREIEGGFYAAKPGPRALCIVAGAGFNFIFAIVIFSILWITGVSRPEQEFSTTIGSFEEGMPAEESSKQDDGLRIGDKILSINERPIQRWNDIIKAVAFADTDEFKIKVLRDDVEKVIEIKSREDKEMGAYRLGIGPAASLLVHEVGEGTLAEEIGLRKGDEILLLDGEPVLSLMDFKKRLKANIGKEIDMVVGRAGKEIALTVTVPEPIEFPEIVCRFPIGFTEVQLEFPPEAVREAYQYPILGFAPSPIGRLTKVYRSPAYSVKETFGLVYTTLGRLFANLVPGSRVTVKPKGLSGPVGILAFISTSMMISFSYYVWFIAFLSLNLGIVNLLPIPVLDGGHILFTAIEKMRKKPLPERIMAVITNVFVVLIITFFLYVTYYDSKRNIVPHIRNLWHHIFG
jgi:regulator of sigma E protease